MLEKGSREDDWTTAYPRMLSEEESEEKGT